MAGLGITGVVVVARPPGLFPPEVHVSSLVFVCVCLCLCLCLFHSLCLCRFHSLCHNLFVVQVTITALIADFRGFHLMESQPSEQDFTGLLWALAVPILGSIISIITRQVNSSIKRILANILNRIPSPGKTCSLFCVCLLVCSQWTYPLNIWPLLGHASPLPGKYF